MGFGPQQTTSSDPWLAGIAVRILSGFHSHPNITDVQNDVWMTKLNQRACLASNSRLYVMCLEIVKCVEINNTRKLLTWWWWLCE